MQIKRILLATIMLLGLIDNSHGRILYYFQKLNVNNGLSQNSVNTILQDSNGFMWFGTRDGLNRYDGVVFKAFRNNETESSGLNNSFIISLFEDKNGNIWVGTDMGIYIYYPKEEKFQKFEATTVDGATIEKTILKIGCRGDGKIIIAVFNSELFEYDIDSGQLLNYNLAEKYDHIRDFAVDNNDRLWISFYSGLYYTDGAIGNLEKYIAKGETIPQAGDVVSRICFGNYNKMYLGTENNGVYEVNLTTRNAEKLDLGQHNRNVFVRDLILYSDNQLWVGTESGLYIYNLKDKSCINITSQIFDPYSISDNAIYSIYEDREGGVWIGSFFGGVNYYATQSPHFNKFYPSSIDGSLQGRRVREICEGENNTIWVGTEDAGLYSYNLANNKFKHFTPSSKFTNIHGLCMDGRDLWVGTFSHGVKIIDTSTGIIKSLTSEDVPATIQDNYVFSIYKASTGYIYIGTANYLIKYDKQTKTFERIHPLDGNLIYDIKEDSLGNIWVATYYNGCFRYDASTQKWEHFVYTDIDGGLPTNKILSVFEDSKKNIWLTTQGGGLCKFEDSTKTFIRFNSTNGLPNDVVFQIQEDDKGFFWLTTNKGLVMFDPLGGNVVNLYTAADGLLGGQFNYKSSYKDKNGNIYFGTTEGMISFNPNIVNEDEQVTPLYITDFQLFNKPVVVGAKDSPLIQSITFLDRIELNHDQNTFSLRIADLGYQASHSQHIVYILDGVDRDWQPLSESSIISYSNLQDGKYRLRIKRDNADNDYEKVLEIEIKPPFYLSTFAYCIYFVLLCLVLYCTYLYVTKRTRRKQQIILDQFEQEKEKELYAAQISFFTNVTHEIRTPLTLIKGPLENIIAKELITDKEVVEDLRIMKQNTDRLHNLTNQLLDFRHTAKDNLILTYVECNISEQIEQIFKRFSSLAKQKGYDFRLTMDADNFYATVDHEAFTKIVSNLFNNAIKYGHSFIHISLLTKDLSDSNSFELRIENDGELVPIEMRNEIFKPFIRHTTTANNNIVGTGIGLPLAQFLAEQHNGSLTMDNRLDLNCFILKLPTKQERVFDVKNTLHLDLETDEEDVVFDNNVDQELETKTILLVEDDISLQQFIRKQLVKDYNVIVVANGKEALDVLNESIVSLVISDIMMPVMDGLELSSTIKNDIHYCHIPVVLLTAQTMIQSKIEGIETGADVYIEKPFSPDYLLAVVANLIQNRAKLREVFTQYPLMATSTIAFSKDDKELLERIRNAILQNISNTNLKIEDIAETLNMSRASFYRKIKGLLDLSPNDYLRIERLKEAARLLREGQHQVGEICYMVGFNSPSYFSKCFHKQFGVLPKDFV